MEDQSTPNQPQSWQTVISSFILNEGKLSDTKKVQSLAKKLGEPFTKEVDKRTPENIYLNYLVSICDGLSPATHIAKLTHSSSKSSSLVDLRLDEHNTSYLSSTSVKATFDGTYDNAALSNYVKFFLLKQNGQILFNALQAGHQTILAPFALNEAEADTWHDVLKRRYEKTPHSDSLLKQVYFPVEENYHLLQVLKSSSLLQALHLTYFDKESRKPYDKANKQRQKAKYSETKTVSFPHSAKLKTVQSQPQNVSVLNGGRSGGKIHLFSSQPPIWTSNLKPPNKHSLFSGEYAYYSQTQTCLDIIAAYLIGYELAGLSQRHPDKYAKLENLVNQLVDSLCNYVLRIHSLEPSWSQESDLKLTHQYWLDPHRKDEEFVKGRQTSDYKAEVVVDFANWLNSQLNKREKGLNLGKEQQRLWIKMTKENFRTFNELLD